MDLKLITDAAERVAAGALVVPCFESESQEAADPSITDQSGWLAGLRSDGEFTGKLHEIAILHRPAGIAAKRLAVIGSGKREKFSPEIARRLGAAAVRSLREKGVRTVAFLLNEAGDQIAQAIGEGAILGS